MGLGGVALRERYVTGAVEWSRGDGGVKWSRLELRRGSRAVSQSEHGAQQCPTGLEEEWQNCDPL